MDEISRAERAPKRSLATVPLCTADDGIYAASLSTLAPGAAQRREDLDVIVYLVAGHVFVTIDGAELEVEPGEAVYLPRGSSALWDVREPTQTIVVSRAAAG